MAVFYKWIKGCGSSGTIGKGSLDLKDSKYPTNDAWTIFKWTDQLWYTKDSNGADFMYAENNPQVYYNNTNHLPGPEVQYSTGRVLTSSARGQECYYDLNFKTYSSNKVSTFQQDSDTFNLTTTTFIINSSDEVKINAKDLTIDTTNNLTLTGSYLQAKSKGGGSYYEVKDIATERPGDCVLFVSPWDSRYTTSYSSRLKGRLVIENHADNVYGDRLLNVQGACRLGGESESSYVLHIPATQGTDEIVSQVPLYVHGYVKASYFNAVSDKRAKENITPANYDALNIIKNLPIYNFNYKSEPEEKVTGILAQDLLKAQPEGLDLVSNVDATGENGDYMSIKNDKLMFVLMKAVQEQQEQIEKLQAEIKQLKA